MLLLLFQSDRPMIHLWYLEIQPLLRKFMVKFISLKYLTKELLWDGILFKWTMIKNKALRKIDVGSNVKCLFAELDFLLSEKQKKPKKNQGNWLKFYVSSVSYLQSQLPFDNSWSMRSASISIRDWILEISQPFQTYNSILEESWKTVYSLFFLCISFRNYWKFMWLNSYSVTSLPNEINSRI